MTGPTANSRTPRPAPARHAKRLSPASRACPTESQEQMAVIAWASLAQRTWPQLRRLHAIPNGGARSKATASRLKAEGVLAGVSDLCLPVAAGPYHGLYLELKALDGAGPTVAQRDWIASCWQAGYAATWCRGAQAAIHIIVAYLNAEPIG